MCNIPELMALVVCMFNVVYIIIFIQLLLVLLTYV